MGLKDQIQVLGLGGNHLYLLSHVTSPHFLNVIIVRKKMKSYMRKTKVKVVSVFVIKEKNESRL